MVSCRLVFLQFNLLFVTLAGASLAQVKPGCLASCGNVSIPYPFGTEPRCYLDPEFLISCSNESKTFITDSNIQVLNISTEGEIRISLYAAMDCYDHNGTETFYSDSWLGLSKFYISNTKNKFTAIGCDTQAFIQGSYGKKFYTGCMSLCDSIDQVMNESCSGIGCCQTSIPRETNMINVTLSSFSNYTGTKGLSNCSYAFIAEEAEFSFSIEDLRNLPKYRKFPVVLDWAVGETTCKEAQGTKGYACNEEQHSVCVDSVNGPGYRCNCSEGFSGNPYLPNGCYDVDECKEQLHNCTQNCTNTVGSYECSCYTGFQGPGRGEQGCIAVAIAEKSGKFWKYVYLGTSAGILLIVMVIWNIWYIIKKRKIHKVREELFKQNGGTLLKNLQSENKGSSKREVKIFTEEELKKATNNFHKGKIVGEGGYGTVYKGILADKTVVAVKKAKFVDPHQIEQFVNEVIILSQVDHDNIVKLLGCCLQTPVPILVYEFITNNTLSFHLHNEGGDVYSSLPWAIRLRIAIETAGGLAHMHSRHIIHRDVKSANILLDDDYTAKVSDFGISRLIPTDKTQLTTLVQGTFGYIDPEYFHSGLLNEKSDVYSFGVVLVELLTGEAVVSQDRANKDKSLAKFFDIALKEGRLFEIVPDQVQNEGPAAQITSMAEVARSCLRSKEEKRPTMAIVERALKQLKQFESHSSIRTLPYPEEIESLLHEDNNLNLMELG